jgi:hypothetical protein
MLTRPFNISPSRKEAVQLALVVHPTAFVAAATLSVLRGYGAGPADFAAMTLGLASALAVSAILYQAFRLVANRPAWLAYLAIVFAVSVAACLQSALDLGAQHLMRLFAPGMTVPALDRTTVTIEVFVQFCLYLVNAAVYWVTFANRKNREQAAELAEARALTAEAELRALRLQLNPHFLFNSLNSATTLISVGRAEEARLMLLKLSDFLRGALKSEATVELADELSAAASYLEVEAVRFPGRLQLEIDCPAHLRQAPVPDFLLQPLVENAVKHALQPGGLPGAVHVQVREEDGQLQIEVSNPLPGVAADAPRAGHGVGQSVTAARLRRLYGRQASLTVASDANRYAVTLRLPIARRGSGLAA